MIIPFERWLYGNDIPEESTALFEESIRCYKISAYRSAFIMSYIAFQNVLKNRMLNARNTPNGIAASWWNSICQKLGDDDTWDSTVAECVKRNSPSRVFLISSSTVNEYEAHRSIRNKCAHGKSGKIEYFHVECLWSFIQENFYRFVINGGQAGIFQEITNHYDRTITAPGKDPSYIVDRIKLGVFGSDLDELLKQFYKLCEDDSIWGCEFSDSNRMIDLWDKLVNESDERIQNSIIRFIIDEQEAQVCDFVGRYPATADKFLSDGAFARKLWTGLLKQCTFDETGFWILLGRIINNNLVPVGEIEEFDNMVFSSVGKSFPDEQRALLEKTSYFDKLRTKLFTERDFYAPNGITHANLIATDFCHYIKLYGLDDKSVSCINQIFSFASYGTFYNQILRLMKEPDILTQYQQIVNEKSMDDYSEKFSSEE